MERHSQLRRIKLKKTLLDIYISRTKEIRKVFPTLCSLVAQKRFRARRWEDTKKAKDDGRRRRRFSSRFIIIYDDDDVLCDPRACTYSTAAGYARFD